MAKAWSIIGMLKLIIKYRKQKGHLLLPYVRDLQLFILTTVTCVARVGHKYKYGVIFSGNDGCEQYMPNIDESPRYLQTWL